MTKLEVTAIPAAGGRRQRPCSSGFSETLTTSTSAIASVSTASKSVSDAKAKFVASVARGVAVLMKEHGYSRERAQTALLREVSRGDITPPSDNEVFEVMSAHGLGMDDAAKALAVSKAVQREIEGREVSVIEAIDDLTSKLSVANLCRVVSPKADSPTTTTTTAPASGGVDTVRIQPLVTHPKRQKSTTSSSSVVPPSTPAPTTTTAPSTTTRKTKTLNKSNSNKLLKTNTRKRTVDEIAEKSSSTNTNNKEETPKIIVKQRARADSLTEVVNAKFADKKEDDIATPAPSRNASTQTTTNVRSKRGLSDVAVVEATQNAFKRSRSAPPSAGDL